MADDTDYSSFFREYEAQRLQREQGALAGASTLTYGTNPDAVGKARQAADYLGVQPAAVEAAPEEFERQARIRKITEDTAGSPVVRRNYTREEFHRLASDDSGILSGVERAIKGMFTPAEAMPYSEEAFGNARRAGRAVEGKLGEPFRRPGDRRTSGGLLGEQFIRRGELGVFEPSPISGLNPAPQFRSMSAGLGLAASDVLGLDPTRAMREFGIAQARAEAASPRYDSITGEAAFGGLQSLISNAPGTAASIATMSPALGLAWAGVQSAGQAYGKYRLRGGTPGQAAVGAVGEGAIEIGTEMMPMGYLVKKFGKAGFGEFVAGLLGREMAGEQVATFAQDAIDTAVANPEKTWGQFWQERPEAAYRTAISTIVQSGAMAGASTAVGRTVMRAQREQYEAQRAEEAAFHVEQFSQLMEASKTRERHAGTFVDLVNEIAAERGEAPAEMYVDAEQLTQTLNQSAITMEELRAVAPEVARQLENPTPGTDVRAPIGELAALGPGVTTALVDHLREGANAMSRNEARQFLSEHEDRIRQEVERTLDQRQEQEAFADQVKEVSAKFEQQIAATGRYSPAVAKANASLLGNFYAVQALRAGVPLQEFMQRYRLQVAAQPPGGGQQMAQPMDTSSVQVTMDERERLVLQDPSNPDITLTIEPDPEDGQHMHGTLEVFDEPAKIGGRGTATRLYLRALRQAQDSGMGWTSEGVASDATRRMYDRLRRMGIPFEEVDGKQVISPQALGAVDLDAVGGGILHQAAKERPEPAAVETLQMVAERGERATGKRAVFSKEEEAAIAESSEKVGVSEREIRAVVREHKLAHPTAQGWAPLTFLRVKLEKGKLVYQYKNIPYDFSNGKDGGQLEPGTPEYKRRVGAVARSMTEEVRRIFKRAAEGDKNASNILAQAGWYKSMRSRLRHEFGGLGDLFADLLGATSPNTPVRDNWANAVDALRRAARGDFDTLMPQWEAWADRVEELETDLRAWFNERLAEGQTKKAIKALPQYESKLEALRAAREVPDDLLPLKETGKKYGFNGKNVMRAMLDLWRVVKNADPDIARGGTAPKALNFSGNLIGFRERATIDVWAARMLQRLAGGLRVPSMAETGVSGDMREDATTTLQFGFGQDVFSDAVRRIRADEELKTNDTLAAINDDDLQAVVWFVEKELWTVNNWTSAAGEGGSFELEASLTGTEQQDRVRELRKTLDSSKSKPAAKAAARQELATLERSVDRFTGGLSTQMSAGTQGVDYVPTDADMARLAEAVRLAVYETDDGATVLASKTLPTEGRYGGAERSLDMEVVAREGYDPNPLWLEMLRQAQEARQDSTFLSRVLRTDEEVDPLRHRPGVEIYFREAAAREQLEAMLADLAQEGVEFLTVVVDGRRSSEGLGGAMPAAVGVRLQYVPEFEQRYGIDQLGGMDDAALAAKMQAKGDELADLATRVASSVEGVSYAGQFWYETQVAFSHQYQEKIDALTTGSAEKATGAPAGQRSWRGQPVREGLASADRQSGEAASGQPGGDVGGDALSTGGAQAVNTLRQGPELTTRGSLSFGQDITAGPSVIALLEGADRSTFIHESGHFFLEVQADLAARIRGRIAAGEEVSDSERGIADDMDAILKWFGVESTPEQSALDRWLGMSLEEKTPHHEAWARGFEKYTGEGKAPSLDLQPLFARFRAWIVDVYKTLTGLNVKLDPEVRAVMDRMIASDAAIAEAQAARNMGPLFRSAEQAGMTGEEYAAYQRLAENATAAASGELDARLLADMKWLSGARTKAMKAAQAQANEQRAEVRREVAPEVMSQRVYIAWAALTGKGELAMPGTPGVEAATASLRLRSSLVKAIDPAAYETLSKRRMTSEEKGWHPDIVAEMYGFESGEQMVHALAFVPPPSEVIDQQTDREMLERHGDITSEAALARAADEAVHNELRARVIAAELKAVARANRVRESGDSLVKQRDQIDVIARAAKTYAAEIIGRQQIKALRPQQYAAAEARSAKMAEKALGKDAAEAAMHKRNQLMNNYATAAAYAAQAEVAKGTQFFRRVLRGNRDDVAKARDWDMVQAMRAILAEYGVGTKGDAAQSYLETIQRNDPATYQVLAAQVANLTANARPINELTVEEFRSLAEELQGMWYLAKRNRQVEIDGELIDLETAKRDLSMRMDDIGVPAVVPGEGQAVTEAERRRGRLRSFFASLKRVEAWTEVMDGSVSGPFRKYVWNPIKDAADAYRADKAKYLTRYRDLLAGLEFPEARIAAPELGYTFGFSRGGSGKMEILHALLHTGNESNKRKLLLGRAWATERPDGTLDTSRWDTFVERMISTGVLSRSDFDFVQSVWDLLEEMKPAAQKTHREVFGRYFDEVTADAFSNSLGTWRGGYVPAMTDPEVVKDAATRNLQEDENATLQFAFPSTAKGFTKSRVEYNQPLLLDLRSLSQHIDKVLMFTHMEQPVREVRRILTSREVSTPLHRLDPVAFDSLLTPWMNRAARQQVETPTPGDNGVVRFFSKLRSRAGMAAMFANLSNTVQQVTGFSLAALKVKPIHMMRATVDYVKAPRQFARAVADQSPYMAGRMDNEVAAMNSAIDEILLNASLYERAQAWSSKHAYFMQAAVDNVMSPIIWTGAYNQAVLDGMNDRDAIRYADSTVRQTQGSNLPEDIADFEAGTAGKRLFTQFAGYFNMQANLIGTRWANDMHELGLRQGMGKGLYIFTLGFYVPALVAQAIAMAFRGGPEDEDKDGEILDDWLTQLLLLAPLKNALAMIPFAGQVGNMALNMVTTGTPADDRMTVSPAIGMLESAVKAPFEVYKAVTDEGNQRTAVRDLATLLSMTTGLPATAVARPAAYGAAVEQGKVEPTSAADAARGFVTGTPSPESRR